MRFFQQEFVTLFLSLGSFCLHVSIIAMFCCPNIIFVLRLLLSQYMLNNENTYIVDKKAMCVLVHSFALCQ
jgi:hypothetical protein